MKVENIHKAAQLSKELEEAYKIKRATALYWVRDCMTSFPIKGGIEGGCYNVMKNAIKAYIESLEAQIAEL